MGVPFVRAPIDGLVLGLLLVIVVLLFEVDKSVVLVSVLLELLVAGMLAEGALLFL